MTTTYNHRDFWETGHGAKGLDRSILKLGDRIEFDNGESMPAYAKWAYHGYISPWATKPFGPFRQLTPAQEVFLARTPNGPGIGRPYVINVDVDGVAEVLTPCGHYVPVRHLVHPSGSAVRTN